MGETSVGLKLLENLEDGGGCPPNVFTYNTIMDSLCKDGLVSEAIDVFRKMKDRKCSPDVISYNCLAHGLCLLSRRKEAMALLSEMLEVNVVPDVVTYNTLINYFCKDGMVLEAKAIVKLIFQNTATGYRHLQFIAGWVLFA